MSTPEARAKRMRTLARRIESLEAELRAEVLAALAADDTVTGVARASGYSRPTLHRWQREAGTRA